MLSLFEVYQHKVLQSHSANYHQPSLGGWQNELGLWTVPDPFSAGAYTASVNALR